MKLSKNYDLFSNNLNICNYLKSISRRHLKISPVIKIGIFFTDFFKYLAYLNAIYIEI